MVIEALDAVRVPATLCCVTLNAFAGSYVCETFEGLRHNR